MNKRVLQFLSVVISNLTIRNIYKKG